MFCVCSGVSAKTNGRHLNKRAFWMIHYWMTSGRKPACRSLCCWVWWRSLISCAPPTHRYHTVTLIISKCSGACTLSLTCMYPLSSWVYKSKGTQILLEESILIYTGISPYHVHIFKAFQIPLFWYFIPWLIRYSSLWI